MNSTEYSRGYRNWFNRTPLGREMRRPYRSLTAGMALSALGLIFLGSEVVTAVAHICSLQLIVLTFKSLQATKVYNRWLNHSISTNRAAMACASRSLLKYYSKFLSIYHLEMVLSVWLSIGVVLILGIISSLGPIGSAPSWLAILVVSVLFFATSATNRFYNLTKYFKKLDSGANPV